MSSQLDLNREAKREVLDYINLAKEKARIAVKLNPSSSEAYYRTIDILQDAEREVGYIGLL